MTVLSFAMAQGFRQGLVVMRPAVRNSSTFRCPSRGSASLLRKVATNDRLGKLAGGRGVTSLGLVAAAAQGGGSPFTPISGADLPPLSHTTFCCSFSGGRSGYGKKGGNKSAKSQKRSALKAKRNKAATAARKRKEAGRSRAREDEEEGGEEGGEGGETAVFDLPFGTDYHVPVLCNEVLEWLVTDKAGVYVDGTLGGGGHSAALLETLDPEALVIGLDRDPDALAEASKRLETAMSSGRFVPLQTNFRDMRLAISSASALPQERDLPDAGVDGILLDLGVSSHQLDADSRGFSHRLDGPLDMRMEKEQGGQTAADFCNLSDEVLIRNVIFQYGEEGKSFRIAKAIIAARPLETTSQLADVVRKNSSPIPSEQNKALSRVFQALRIKVNGELDALEEALEAARALVKPGGRIVVMSYHSLEDRRVKHIFSSGTLKNKQTKDFYGNVIRPWRPLTRKPLMASDGEQLVNRRARSVRMRVAERTEVE